MWYIKPPLDVMKHYFTMKLLVSLVYSCCDEIVEEVPKKKERKFWLILSTTFACLTHIYRQNTYI